MKTAIVEEEHQSVAAAAEENDSSSSQQSGGTGGGYAADGSASDDADDNNVSSGSFKLSVECFRQHQHHHDAVSHQDNMQHSHSHHPSRHKRRLMKRSSSPSTIPHITSGTNSRSNNDVAAAAAAAHHWDSVLNNTNIESQDQRQAIEIFLANGATSIDSHIQLMSLVSSYYDTNGCMPPMPPMPPAFSQQQQHQEVAAGAAEEPFVQPELSEGFTAFFTTTHSSGVQSETGTGTSALTSSSSKSRPPPSKQPSITQHDQKNRGGHGSGGESSVGSSLSSSECSQPNKPQKTIHEGGSSGVNHVTSGTHVNKNVALYAADTDGPSKKRRTTEATRSTAVYQRSSSSIDAPGRDERELSKTLTTGPRQERGQVETSAPKSSAEDSPLVPGQPVTLDQVLRFSNIPRLIVKAVPPFHVVHANAAYYRLTAGENDNVVGAAISSLLSLPNNDGSLPRTTSTLQNDAANHDGSPLGSDSKHPLLQVQDDPSVVCLERLVVAGGFGRCHLIQMIASPPKKKTSETNNDVDDGKRSAAVLSSTPVLLFSTTIAPVASDIHVMEQRKQQQYMSSSLVAGSSNNIMSRGQQHYQPPTTHYVIQLEPCVEQVDSVMVNSGGLPALSIITSGTSSSVEEEGHAPPPLGLSKQEVDRLLRPVLVMPTFGNHNGGAVSAFTHHIVQA